MNMLQKKGLFQWYPRMSEKGNNAGEGDIRRRAEADCAVIGLMDGENPL
jgi:hypothetical protein